MKHFVKNIRYDLPASIIVFFVALPLCLGIAFASGAPIFSGVISGIVGGVLVGALSGSRFGVSGPAAGLTVIVLGYITTLGSWENFLVAVVLAGMIQVLMGFMRLGSIAYYCPAAVVKGMLTGIGLVIIIKQFPHALGYDIQGLENVAEFSGGNFLDIRAALSHLTPAVVIISVVSMTVLISWENYFAKQHRIFKAIPAPIIVVILGMIMSSLLELHDHQIVQLPVSENLGQFFKQFTLPNFDALRHYDIYSAAVVIAIVASLETLLSVEATDKLDTVKQVTPTNRELKAQGIGNIVCGLIGGLPITQVIVRSSANVAFGARSKISTISHGILLLISAITIPQFLNMIPLASLACILIILGYKLAKPIIFKKAYKSGWREFAPFVATVLGVVFFDLLKGVGLGIAVAGIYYIKKADKAIMTLNQESRDSITPEEATKLLKEGNERFVNNLKADRNLLKQVNETSTAQFPFAIILSCIDSRTSAELIFDQGLGDVLSCRIAGNILNDDILGSMEFACKVAGARLVMVLGHTECGAIKSACDDVKIGHITHLLSKIKPALKLEKSVKHGRHSKNPEFVEKVASLNVKVVQNQVVKKSKILKSMVDSGEIDVIGGMYNVATGKVDFYK